MRESLQRVLASAWRQVIENDYVNQRVNSERSLQAAFWSQLNQKLPPTTRRLFVEPSFRVETGKTILPDLVVCNTKEVIAVIELKYQPRVSPSLGKDLRSLASLSQQHDELSITNRRFLGESSGLKSYPFSPKTLFVWAGVYRLMAGTETLTPDSIDVPVSLQGAFLSLHAMTARGTTPKVVVHKS